MRCVSHPPSPPRLQPERSNASFRCGRPLVCGGGKLGCNAIAVACLAAIRRECEDELGREHAMHRCNGARVQTQRSVRME